MTLTLAANGSSLTDSDLRFITESIPHIVWMAAPDGSTEYFNRQGTTYSGWPPEANCGWDWVSLVHPDDAIRARLAWGHATRTQTPFRLDYRIRRFDGEYRSHTFRALPFIDDRGALFKWIGTATDIEDIKRSEAGLRLAYRKTAETLRVCSRRCSPRHPSVSGSWTVIFGSCA
jgi:PAS domain S-box-containing protein